MLVTNAPGNYIDVRGNIVSLNKDDVWKYGETTQGYARYTQPQLDNMIPGGVRMIPILPGNQIEIKLHEKLLIYDYFFTTGSLPPGNKIFR